MRHGARFLILSVAALLAAGPARADEATAKDTQEMVRRGREWLVSAQQADGHYSGKSFASPIALTALSGLALLMDERPALEGKQAESIRRAADWLMQRSQASGLIGDPKDPAESRGGYMFGHGYAMLFLASLSGEEKEARRKRIDDVLTRAVQFSADAQTTSGGWGYVSALDSNDFDEMCVTTQMVQALRAARMTGIVVPKKVLDNAAKYLEKLTSPRGGVFYTTIHRVERPSLTVAALACFGSADEFGDPAVKKRIAFCKTNLPFAGAGRFGFSEYDRYYGAQVVYQLGDEGYARLFPDSAEGERLTWSKYRSAMVEHLKKSQADNGSWESDNKAFGGIFATAIYLTLLQLENGTLPIYQR